MTRARSASARAGFGDDRAHRHVEALRVDRFELLELETDADRQRPRRQARQRPVEIAAAIAEPVAGAVETDERREHDRRHDDFAFFRDRNVPDAVDERLAGAPGAVFERALLVDNDRQRDRAPAKPPPTRSAAADRTRRETASIRRECRAASRVRARSSASIAAPRRRRSSAGIAWRSAISRSRSARRQRFTASRSISPSSLRDHVEHVFAPVQPLGEPDMKFRSHSTISSGVFTGARPRNRRDYVHHLSHVCTSTPPNGYSKSKSK